jgi:hypothetical protein
LGGLLCGVKRGLHQPACRHAHHFASADDQVIKDPHAQEFQGGGELSRDGAVCRTGFCNTARMIVSQDRCGSIDGQGRSGHFPRVNACAIDGAGEELFDAQDPVAVIEPHDVEFLVQQCAEARSHEVAGIAGISDAALAFELAPQDALGGGQHVGFGDSAAALVVSGAVLDEAHGVLPWRGIAPWVPVSEARKGAQHRRDAALRQRGGGNIVDEGNALARSDREANLAHG